MKVGIVSAKHILSTPRARLDPEYYLGDTAAEFDRKLATAEARLRTLRKERAVFVANAKKLADKGLVKPISP